MPSMFQLEPLPSRGAKTPAGHESLCRNDAVKPPFAFLVKFSHACPSDDLHGALWGPVTDHGQITIAAAADAVGNWYKQEASQQPPLVIPGGHLGTGRASATWRNFSEGHP